MSIPYLPWIYLVSSYREAVWLTITSYPYSPTANGNTTSTSSSFTAINGAGDIRAQLEAAAAAAEAEADGDTIIVDAKGDEADANTQRNAEKQSDTIVVASPPQ